MQIGLIGAGNMARGLALGWGRPVLCFDVVADRAAALAQEAGGEALASGVEVAQRSDLVVLCHKPAQLRGVAAELAPHARAVVSILAATPLADVKAAYPDRPVYRALPSTPVAVRQGAVILAADDEQDAPLDEAVRGLLEELGTLVVLDDDTLAVRRAVTSPGGSTARGLDALERGGVRAAFSSALDAILKR